jgi:hypothetical protein
MAWRPQNPQTRFPKHMTDVEKQIAYCEEVWAALCADQPIALETSEAIQYASRTRCNHEGETDA